MPEWLWASLRKPEETPVGVLKPGREHTMTVLPRIFGNAYDAGHSPKRSAQLVTGPAPPSVDASPSSRYPKTRLHRLHPVSKEVPALRNQAIAAKPVQGPRSGSRPALFSKWAARFIIVD